MGYHCNKYPKHKRRCDECHRHTPDVVMVPGTPGLKTQDTAYTLPMINRECTYDLSGDNMVLTTLKDDRELVVRVKSATNIKIEISIQTGTDTPRVITFENTEKVKFVEDLKNGDHIVFSQTYTGGEPLVLDFAAAIRRKCNHW